MSYQGRCFYHLCRKKAEVDKCKYCHQDFCKEHLKPKPAGLPKFKSSDSYSQQFMKEYHSEKGHPCIPYTNIWNEESKNKKELEGKEWDKFLNSSKKIKNSSLSAKNWALQIDEISRRNYEKETSSLRTSQSPVPHLDHLKKSNFDLRKKLKEYYLKKYGKLKYWLREREYPSYNFEGRANYLITTILIFAASIAGIAIFYSNVTELNQVRLGVIKLGGVLILTSLFFAIKYGKILGKELINIFKRQRNWFRCLLVILIVMLLWQSYTHRDNVLNPVFGAYNKTNFSLFVPLTLDNFNLNSTSGPDKGNPKSSLLDRDVVSIEQEILVLVNEERQRNGARALTSKSNLNSYARSWSEKMISEGFFEHSNLNYPYPSIAGENIAETPIHYNVGGCGSTYTNHAIAKCFVDGWIESHGHYENMISRKFSMTGVGVACDFSKCRATQVFSG